MTITQSREVRLRSRPTGLPGQDTFGIETVRLDDPGIGEVQVRNDWMSVDPYMRNRMIDQPSYVPPFQIGKVLEGGAVGTVMLSNDDRLRVGDTVLSFNGWREGFNAPAKTLTKVDAGRIAPEAYLGVAGLTGLTAYHGLLHVIRIAAGETIFVSGATGAVGSAACQIAKLKGATVIGAAGGAEKCAYLREIGVDHVVDYRAVPDLTAAVAAAAPEGLDAYFDNVGGAHLDAALAAAKPFARFAMCGMIAAYNRSGDGPSAAPANLLAIVTKRLQLQGFIVSDHFDTMPEFVETMLGWITAGTVTWRQTVDHGLEQAPGAFLKLFSGGNVGKMLVKLS